MALITVLLVVAPIVFPVQASPQASSAPYHQLEMLFQQGKLEQAERMLRAELAKRPPDARLLDLLGVVLDAEHRYPESEQCYLKALHLFPDSPAILNNLGNHYVAEGKAELAAKAFRQVVALQP